MSLGINVLLITGVSVKLCGGNHSAVGWSMGAEDI